MEVKVLGYSSTDPEDIIPGYTAADSIVMKAISKCYQSKPNPNAIKHCLERSHYSVFEHISFTFEVNNISRTCLAQLTRHRMASFSVESQRYCDYTKKHVDFIVPDNLQNNTTYDKAITNAFTSYKELRSTGIPPEDARFVLPEATATNLVFTMNARGLMHCFDLRLDKHAQWEIRKLFSEVLKYVKVIAPLTFQQYEGADEHDN